MIVQSNWKVSDDRPITDTIVACDVESDNGDLEDEITVENCVMLEAPEIGDGLYPTNPACQLLINCEPPNQISRISVISEARVIEVYGHHGEYLKTTKNVLLDESEDMVVFRGDVILDRPSSLCSIKFLLLRSPTEMWLFGVKVYTTKSPFDIQNQMTIPLSSVEERLSHMGLALSDKAEAFKQLVQTFQKSPMADPSIGDMISNLLVSNLVKNKSPSPEKDLQKLGCLMKSVPTRDSENNVSEAVPGMMEDPMSYFKKKLIIVNETPAPYVIESVPISTQTEEDVTTLEENIKSFVAEQMEEMEKKLWEKINKRFQETEAKIICKLDEIESFVKPQGVKSN
ncbi:hypothetical protein JTE90_026692 [Oedothorax gibbosus]|uniref:Uncharacterized protein n=1 Tax=Oedothorax gibbosus TaxID=931172 RepID=A0AAV6V0L1_9ARAC|nr:hypothetical protein JTE90_026692 [Oedothorax gibbosus]